MGHKKSRRLRKYRRSKAYRQTVRLEQIHAKYAKRLAARFVIRGPELGDPTPEEIRQGCVAIRRKRALTRLKQISYGDAYRDETPHEDYWPSVSHRAVPIGSIRRGWYRMGSGRYRRSLNYKFED
jgi:hypothetical protein